jgi:hypothetical protein
VHIDWTKPEFAGARIVKESSAVAKAVAADSRQSRSLSAFVAFYSVSKKKSFANKNTHAHKHKLHRKFAKSITCATLFEPLLRHYTSVLFLVDFVLNLRAKYAVPYNHCYFREKMISKVNLWHLNHLAIWFEPISA